MEITSKIIVEWIEKNGFEWAMALIFLLFVIYYAKKLDPRLKGMEIALNKSLERERNYEAAVVSNAKAMDEIADSLKLLNATLEGNLELMKMYYDDNKNLSKKLQEHDDKSRDVLHEVKIVRENQQGLKELIVEKFNHVQEKLELKEI